MIASNPSTSSPNTTSSSSNLTPPNNNQHEQHHILLKLKCGLFSGFIQAGMFNPWDRALYLSVKNNTRFLDKSNFTSPFQGVFQTLTHRAISSGLFFPLEELFSEIFAKTNKSNNSEETSSFERMYVTFMAGTMAGAINGILMNPVSAIKYHYWGLHESSNHTIITLAIKMYKNGGIRPFLLGSTATISRDIIFGSVFSLLRHELQRRLIQSSNNSSQSPTNTTTYNSTLSLCINIFSACCATILSSPLNYIRNMHYATSSSKKAASCHQILNNLWQEAIQKESLQLRIRYLLFRLRIGWGTARVGCGMGVGAFLYSICSHH